MEAMAGKRGWSQTKTWYQFYRIRVPVGPWCPRKIFLSSKMMNYQPQHMQKREKKERKKERYVSGRFRALATLLLCTIRMCSQRLEGVRDVATLQTNTQTNVTNTWNKQTRYERKMPVTRRVGHKVGQQGSGTEWREKRDWFGAHHVLRQNVNTLTLLVLPSINLFFVLFLEQPRLPKRRTAAQSFGIPKLLSEQPQDFEVGGQTRILWCEVVEGGRELVQDSR